MSSTANGSSCPVKKGTYAASTKTDLRGPCPLVNSLANHGYIPRDGREVHAAELQSALSAVGLSMPLRAFFANPIFLEKYSITSQQKKSFFGRMLDFIRNPWSLLAKFGMRTKNQVDSMGKVCLNLDQLALAGVVEHDISLTRLDHAQGDAVSIQQDLVSRMLSYSLDDEILTADDLVRFRKQRIEEQTAANPHVNYGKDQHQIGCFEIALILNVFGDGKTVPCEYVRAFFAEERLPVKEGWKKRSWWHPLGLLELRKATKAVGGLIGMTFEPTTVATR